MAALTETEQFRLAQCERQIDIHMRSWIETGTALEQIRRERLYRASHKTFELYCRRRWKLTRRHTDRLIDAANTAHNLGILRPIGLISEGAIRPLTSLSAEDQCAAWSLALKSAPRDSDGNPKITAKLVADAVKQVAPPVDDGSADKPSNVIKLRRSATITLTPGKPEQAVQKLLQDADDRDIVEFYSELGYTLHRLGKITGWIEVIQQWVEDKRRATQ